MKCSKCGREFGNGANCQNCGVDRVTGLGNYSGYDKPSGNYEPQYSSSNNGGYAPNTTVCYACSEIVPANSVYCPVCGRKLLVECPNCGSTYSSQYKICSKCGTNRDVYYKQEEAERQKALREEEVRQRKQKEWENSLEYLRNELQNTADRWRLLVFLFLIPFVVVLMVGVSEIQTSYPFIKIVISIIGVILLILIIDKFIRNYTIENWKSKNPNDPRNKYL